MQKIATIPVIPSGLKLVEGDLPKVSEEVRNKMQESDAARGDIAQKAATKRLGT